MVSNKVYHFPLCKKTNPDLQGQETRQQPIVATLDIGVVCALKNNLSVECFDLIPQMSVLGQRCLQHTRGIRIRRKLLFNMRNIIPKAKPEYLHVGKKISKRLIGPRFLMIVIKTRYCQKTATSASVCP